MELEVADNGSPQKKTFYVVNKGVEEPTGTNAVLNFLYNKETHEILGRTCLSWVKIVVFYVIFYICLAIFSLAMFALFWKFTIVEDRPRWILEGSLIGSTPGVGFRPMPDQDNNAESTLLWINLEKDAQGSYWTARLDEYFKTYSNQGKPCSYGGDSVDDKESCDVDVESFGKCNKANGYGYENKAGSPCVLLKLNKIFDWVPIPYDGDTIPTDMPSKLQDHIKSLSSTGANELNTTWITCQPENTVDREHLGPIEYFSLGGASSSDYGMIPGYYYPYKMQKGYESPVVFVRFEQPAKNVLIQVECRAWAQNIGYNRQFRVGSVHFELMID